MYHGSRGQSLLPTYSPSFCRIVKLCLIKPTITLCLSARTVSDDETLGKQGVSPESDDDKVRALLITGKSGSVAHRSATASVHQETYAYSKWLTVRSVGFGFVLLRLVRLVGISNEEREVRSQDIIQGETEALSA